MSDTPNSDARAGAGDTAPSRRMQADEHTGQDEGPARIERVGAQAVNVPGERGASAPAVVRDHVVFLIHGIRTRGEWETRIAEALRSGDPSLNPIPIGYGYFDVLRFLLPFRKRPVERVRRKIEAVLMERSGVSKVSIIAHSFGTYIVGRILQASSLRLHRLILCGSILPEDYNWAAVEPKLDPIEDPDAPLRRVVNDCGWRDIWPVFARFATFGYGPTGRFGFGHPQVFDRYHDSPHSGYFREEFTEEFWLPVLTENRIPRDLADRPPEPWWVNMLSLARLPIVLLVLLVALLVPRLLGDGETNGGDGETNESTSTTASTTTTTTAPSTTTTAPSTTTTATTTTTTTTTVPPPTVTVPNVVGSEKEAAERELASAGLEIGEISEIADDERAGRVVSTDPGQGEEVEKGAKVNVVIARAATSAETYLEALFAVTYESRFGGGPVTLWSGLGLLANAVDDHMEDFEDAFNDAYLNEDKNFLPESYSAADYQLRAADAKEEAARLRDALGALAVDPPAEVKDLHLRVVADVQDAAEKASAIEDKAFMEKDDRWPQSRREERRESLIEMDRTLDMIKMDLQRLCVGLLPDHASCRSVVGSELLPDPVTGIYVHHLVEMVEPRLDGILRRSCELWENWENWEEVRSLGDERDYHTMITNEGFWWLLARERDVRRTEASALVALTNRLRAPAPLSELHAAVVDVVKRAAREILEMVKAFQYGDPRENVNEVPPEIEKVAQSLRDLRDTIASVAPSLAFTDLDCPPLDQG